MDAICEDRNLRQQLLPLYALLQRLPVKPWRSRKRERSREWTISVWPALWSSCLGRWHVGTFKPFCCQTQQGSIKSMNPQFGWYYYCLCQPHCLHLHGKQDLEGHMLLPLRRCTLSLLPTKKGKVLEGLPLFASFLFFWLEENVLDLHW